MTTEVEWALVTGASGGIGAALAVQAARAGYGVILSARSEDRLRVQAGKLERAYNVPVLALPADLSRPAEAGRLWQAAVEGRRISILVNNAGLGHFGPFADTEGWRREDESLAVNLLALTMLMKLAVPTMLAAGQGRILNVASTAAFQPGPHLAVYSATKSYVLSLSEAVAEELSGSGVTVTALCPGATETGFFAADAAEGATWLSRAGLAQPDKVAEIGWRAMMAGRRVVIPGMLNKLVAFSNRLVPRRMVTWLGAILLKRRD